MSKVQIIQEGIDIDTGLAIIFPWVDGIEFPKVMKEVIPIAIQYLSHGMEKYCCHAVGRAILSIGGHAEAGCDFSISLPVLGVIGGKAYLEKEWNLYHYFSAQLIERFLERQIFFSGWYRRNHKTDNFDDIHRRSDVGDTNATDQLNSVYRQCRIAWLTYMLHHATFTE